MSENDPRSYAEMAYEADRYEDGEQWLAECYQDMVAEFGEEAAKAWRRGEQ